MPSSPAWASKRYGYQTMPHSEAPATSAHAGRDAMALMDWTCDSKRPPMVPTVLHVAALLGGGVDRHLRDIARSVPGRHVLWHAGESADVLEFPADGRLEALDPARIDADPAALASLLRNEGVGLVHLHSNLEPARKRALQAAKAAGAR